MFEFNGRKFPTSKAKYERKVEVPVTMAFLSTLGFDDVLEVGNVLQHNVKCPRHTVVDKYEKGKGVINIDAIDIKFKRRVKNLVCISTLEHIGYDRPETRSVEKAFLVLDRLMAGCVNGVVTFPLGYNKPFDTVFLKTSEKRGLRTYFMHSDDFVMWKQVVRPVQFDYGKRISRTLVLGFWGENAVG